MEEEVKPVEEPQVEPVETSPEETPVAEAAPEEKVEVEPDVEPPLVIPPPKKKQTAQERFDELTRLRREAERQAQAEAREKEYWRNIALQKEQAAKAEKPAVQVPILTPRPVISNFDTTEAYEDAYYDWRKQLDTAQTQAEQARIREEQEQKRIADNWRTFDERGDSLRAIYDDYDKVISAKVFTPAMQEVLVQSEVGPEISYYLGRTENRAVVDKILSLPPARQIYELGKLEERFVLAKRTKKVPGAPPPINPVGMSGKTEVDPDKMSVEEWMEWDKQRTLEKIKAKLKSY